MKKKIKNSAYIIFTRIPESGKTKTRLMPYYSGDECKIFHEKLLMDLCEKTKSDEYDIITFYSGDDLEYLKGLLHISKDFFAQKGITIAERMKNAIKETLDMGYKRIVLTGSDIPDIDEQIISDAFNKLQNNSIVFGPSNDGGYYLVGVNDDHDLDAIFDEDNYKNDNVLKNIENKIQKEIKYTKVLRDIDTKDDILAYYTNNLDKDSHATHYIWSKLKISVIVPIYNEEKKANRLMEELKKFKNSEIILVDGESTDNSYEILSKEFNVIRTKKGRSNQLNSGSKHASGDILFFLHADSLLPPDPEREIKEVIKKNLVGIFGIRFDRELFMLKVCEIRSMQRVKYTKIMFGDQGIFIFKNLFNEVGGFPNIPIMEDYQFSLELRKKKINIGITKNRIITSARRFGNTNMSVFKMNLKMYNLRRLYRKGVDAKEILKSYRDER